jgi:hypothetical protein
LPRSRSRRKKSAFGIQDPFGETKNENEMKEGRREKEGKGSS